MSQVLAVMWTDDDRLIEFALAVESRAATTRVGEAAYSVHRDTRLHRSHAFVSFEYLWHYWRLRAG